MSPCGHSLPYDIIVTSKGEAVSDTERKRGEANADNATYWNLYDYHSSKTQKPPPGKVSGF